MKKYLLLFILLTSSFVFAGCSAPEGGVGDSILNNFRGDTSGTTTEEKEVIPQVGAPVSDDFKEPISEMAKIYGITNEDLLAVRTKLAETFNMDLAEVEITAENESTAEFMTGYVNVGEGDKGGVYFTAKTQEGWQIAYNGVGIVYCEPINKYNFPVGMVPKCYDATTGMSVERE